jgi:hypothetical protein
VSKTFVPVGKSFFHKCFLSIIDDLVALETEWPVFNNNTVRQAFKVSCPLRLKLSSCLSSAWLTVFHIRNTPLQKVGQWLLKFHFFRTLKSQGGGGHSSLSINKLDVATIATVGGDD